ncbi:hypothetical protein [Nocardioides sp.]|uniref:hypothetical protein n=1 Tax=Nocardioides sp. TaxID=35761 RepID=UPI00321ABEA1
MSELLRGIPGLYWVAFAFLGLALWTDDVFGIYIGAICMVVGTLQLVRVGRDAGTGREDGAGDGAGDGQDSF